ncbi:hypothetical protein [Sphingobacterium wenxiniae]|uniref:Uncharacterized protein n=1 Tax=Sphingobacterium wenxiniae TaxID=683125 RepID=A0A1I6VW28_9SPHI|nr:hypothetical protein [Sphingobacterium wenxiniae]SFT17920.1 hypothetical protein SAMN05660206_11828 [Sphingobacterium wenxiniae]
MKKILLACLIGTSSLLTLNSCTKEYNNYDMVPSITMVYERTANQWQTHASQDKYLDLNVPELKSYFVDQGIVNIAISFDNEKTYLAIPATFDGVAYSYDYTTGSVRIYAQDPIYEDGISITVPSKVVIKISLTESDFVQ